MDSETRNAGRFEGRFYEKTAWDNVTCRLCPHSCSIAPSRTGSCGVRSNRDGALYVDNYGRVTAQEVLSGEDLPLYHFKPSISWLALAGKGCTMRCPFCNTYKYSQIGGVRQVPLMPADAIAHAKEIMAEGISFGGNEPAPMHEYVADVFSAARETGIATHVTTGGMWSTDALRELVPVLDSATVGLKGFEEAFFSETLGADLSTIKNNIDLLYTLKVHLEISWLLIPGVTDSEIQARRLLSFLESKNISVPIIILPYYPDFTWKKPSAASLNDLKRFRGYFQGYGSPVYEHHQDSAAINTVCPRCGRALIRRGMAGLIITSHPTGKPKDQCPSCGAPIPYVL